MHGETHARTTAQTRAEAAFEASAQALADYTAAVATSPADRAPGEAITYAVNMRALSLRVVNAAVALERAAGSSWGVIGAALRARDVDTLPQRYPDDEMTDLVDATLDGRTAEQVTDEVRQWSARHAFGLDPFVD